MKYFYLFFVFFLFSCKKQFGIAELGDGYYLMGNYIVYSLQTSEEQFIHGETIVPTKIDSVFQNDTLIISSTFNKLNENRFWIIQRNAERNKVVYHETDDVYNSYYEYTNVICDLSPKEFDDFKNKHDLLSIKFKAIKAVINDN